MGEAASPNVDIILGGTEIKDSDLVSHSIERDMYQPDYATIVISNQGDAYGGKFGVGDSVEIKVGKPAKSVYQGEILGVEGKYTGGDTTKLTVKSMSKLHKLLRKRHSETYTNTTDQEILNKVVGRHGLSLDWKGPTIQYKHVYQHNLSDLEFIRLRAARIGCHVWCVGSKLFVKEPDFSKTSSTKLSVDKAGILRGFSPRISSSTVTKKVTVKGWDPEKKVEIVGTATASSSPLGPKSAVAACGNLVSPESFLVDQPVGSKQEADALAKARLTELNLQYITGEAEVKGGAEFDLGEVVEIEANAMGKDPFNGKYYIMGISHRHTLPKKSEGGYISVLKLARDAQGA